MRRVPTPSPEQITGPAAGSPAESTRRKAPGGRRWLFRAAAVLIGLLVAEAISCLGLHLLGHSLVSLHATQDDLAMSGVPFTSAREAIHPYLGWVLNPDTHPGETLGGRHVAVNALGLLDENQRPPRRSDDRLIVVVVGGSVACQMTILGERRFLESLAARPEAAGREIVLVRLAMSGYKQPQQLMALNYLLSLGLEFDVAVNIDGYNEIALSTCDNHDAGVFLAYPRDWHARMAEVVDPREYGLTFRLLEARAKRQLSAVAMTSSPLRWSPTRNLIWLLQQRQYNVTIAEIGLELLQKQGRQGRGFHADGPDQWYADDDELFSHAVDLWVNASVQLQRLCAANGAAYVHVLQPNQYLPGSKPMGPDELEDAVYEEQKFGHAVRRGYPLLIESSARLRAAGVAFTDLTMLFAQTPQQIYVDLFCHYNQLGNEMLAEAVANLVGDALAADTGADRRD